MPFHHGNLGMFLCAFDFPKFSQQLPAYNRLSLLTRITRINHYFHEELIVVKIVDFGVYLGEREQAEDKDTVLLPKKQDVLGGKSSVLKKSGFTPLVGRPVLHSMIT